MKHYIAVLILACAPACVFAQHDLVGTWELLTTTGTDADGNPFALDTTTVRETKIITPTHYILIARNVNGSNESFNRCYAGSIEVNGNHYVETPRMASVQIVPDLKVNYTWELRGDLFIQRGTIVRPDGRKVTVELTFRKVTPPDSYPDNPAIGTWDITSSTYRTPGGEAITEAKPTVRVMEIVTPTHWMGISYRNNRFENAMGGTYTMADGKMFPETHYSALNIPKPRTLELSCKRNGDELIVEGMTVSASGETVTWQDHAVLLK